MPTVHLKTGEVIQVPIEELEDYLLKNQDNIVIRQVLRRGERRSKLAPQNNSAA
jgi:hypothetical protein